MRLAKAQLPEIAPAPKIPAATTATEREPNAPPSNSKEKKVQKTNKGSRRNGSISAAPKAPGSAEPPAPSKKKPPAKSPPPPGEQP